MKKLMLILLTASALFVGLAGVNFYLNSSTSGMTRTIMGGLLVADCLVYFLLILFINSRSKVIRALWIAVIVVNLVMTFTDNVGLADLMFVAVNGAVLYLYIRHVLRDNHLPLA